MKSPVVVKDLRVAGQVGGTTIVRCAYPTIDVVCQVRIKNSTLEFLAEHSRRPFSDVMRIIAREVAIAARSIVHAKYKIESWHIEALKYLSRRGKPVPEDDLTPLTLEHLDVCAAHGLVERVKLQGAHFWRLTDQGRHVAAIGRFE